MQSGGKIMVRVREVRNWKSDWKGDGKSVQKHVRLTIADTGTGMSFETRQHMFEPFFTTKSNTGTGLGLWVSAEILANHRASTHVRSSQRQDRHGTVISIVFPDVAA
jgi:signal transduction histidine kinase